MSLEAETEKTNTQDEHYGARRYYENNESNSQFTASQVNRFTEHSEHRY